ncbi:hypothetical protein ACRDNQ_03745 [Palleronia sp. KMU-117]|uniref:hypothetical protein n=1 Tax=Palleronia sp. KMU-117 TaxID=3434108 RepID=UPI003D7175C3
MLSDLIGSGAGEAIRAAGQGVVHYIIALAQLLTKSESSPGIVAILLLAALVVFGVLFFLRTGGQIRAVRRMHDIITRHENVETFAQNFEQVRSELGELSNSSRTSKELWKAWDEFRETLVADDIDGPIRLRNSVRPASFLNVADLGYGPGLYRILPNTFVSLGLLLTFLGLVAALFDFSNSMSATGPGSETSMNNAMIAFMQIASAKFVMSLVGLVCSILFTILLRHRLEAVDRALHRLCIAIERRLVFVSLEDIGFRQLRAATEQREHLREIGFSMVAELRKPLEELPDQIGNTISNRMDPIFEKVSALGTSSMEGLVGDLSNQLSHSVGNALNRASESLGEASDRMSRVIDQMNASNAQAGDGLQTALGQLSSALQDLRAEVSATGAAASSAMTEGADQLLSVMNETLSGIRENTADGARQMSRAVEEMRKAAESFREQIGAAAADGAAAVQARMDVTASEATRAIEGTGKTLIDSFEATSRQIADLGKELGGAISEELLTQLEDVSGRLADMSDAIERGADGARRAATGLSAGAESIAGASTTFDAASRSLVAATDPLRSSQERIERAIGQLSSSIEMVSGTLQRSSAQIAADAARVLETAQTALGTEREGIRQSLEATGAALQRLSQEAAKLDQIDEMLGRALTAYAQQLEAALGKAQDHITEMRDTLAPGLDTLKGVVEQAESFIPAQRQRA